MFQLGQKLFVGLTFQSRGEMGVHVSLWQTINKPDIKTYDIVKVQSEYGDPTDVLFFKTQEAYDSFKTWWDNYTARFTGDEYVMSFFPRVANTQHISGWVYRHEKLRYDRHDVRSKKFRDEWRWICEFTQDKVWWTQDFWLFENEAEMVMFKLKGKIQNEDEEDNLPF